MVHRIVSFCGGRYAFRIRLAYPLAFLRSLCQNIPLFMGAYLLRELLGGRATAISCIYCSFLLFCSLCMGCLLQYVTDRLVSTTGYEVLANKRREFAEHLRRLPMGFFTEGNLGKISSILSNDMIFIEENGINIVADVVGDFFSQMVLTVFLFTLHPLLGGMALVCEGAAAALAIPMNREALRNSVKRQEASEELTESLLEYIQGLPVAKSFLLTGKSAKKLRESFAKSRRQSISFEEEHTPWERRLQVVYAFGSTLILLMAIYLNQEGELDAGNLITLLLFLLHMFSPLKHLYQMDSRLTIMESCLNRLEEVLARAPLPEGSQEVKLSGDSGRKGAGTGQTSSREDCMGKEEPSGTITFQNVSFSYGREKVLKDISFQVREGEMVALVGESGGGKTTVANLLARFWDIQEGEICLGGVNIKDLTMESLMKNVSMVFQRVYLFEDTVYENIAMGRKNASFDEVAEAARRARCLEFIEKLPYGFDTRIGEGGASLSGGEAQRISIARCLLKDAPVLILDEATASIDLENEREILTAMRELCRGRTVLVIAHRLHTIRGADQILVLEKGRIVERGNHASLMKEGGRYRRMAELQGAQGSWNKRKKINEGKDMP